MGLHPDERHRLTREKIKGYLEKLEKPKTLFQISKEIGCASTTLRIAILELQDEGMELNIERIGRAMVLRPK
jgi:biotin operon repressor